MRTWSKFVLVLFSTAASVGLVTALMFLPDKGESMSDGGAIAMAMLWMFVAAPVFTLIGLIAGVLIVRRGSKRHTGTGWTTYDSIARGILILTALFGLAWAGVWARDDYHRRMADTRELVLQGYLQDSATARWLVQWSEDTTRLFGSALLGDRVALENMLRHGAPVDRRDALGHTPLMWAAIRGNTAVLDVLLRHGADPNAVDRQRSTALHLMADCDHVEALALLAQNGADVNRRDRAGRTPLMIVVNRYYPEEGFAKMLIDHGADPNTRDMKGLTPLMVAASSLSPDQVVGPAEVVHEGDHAPIVEILVNAGAQVNARGPNGRTALMMAAKAGHLNSVRILLGHGADPALRDSDGRTAWELASKDGPSRRAVRELLRQHSVR